MALTQVDQGLLGTYAQYTGFKNRIINGAMQIAQRATSFNLPNSAWAYGSLDRWIGVNYNASGTAVMNQSSQAPTGFTNSLQLGRAAGNATTSAIGFKQQVESNNCQSLQGQPVTLSFWSKAGANFSGSFFTAYILSGTGVNESASGNNFTGQVTVATVNQVITTTWTKYSITGTFPSNANEVWLWFQYTPTGTAGADDNVYVTGVQFEAGSAATSFDYRPYGTELALCQRYYAKTFPQGTAPAANTGLNGAIAGSSSATNVSFATYWKLPATMRTSPSTITTYNPTVAASSSWSDQAGLRPTVANVGGSDNLIQIQGTTSILAGGFYTIHITADAEL